MARGKKPADVDPNHPWPRLNLDRLQDHYNTIAENLASEMIADMARDVDDEISRIYDDFGSSNYSTASNQEPTQFARKALDEAIRLLNNNRIQTQILDRSRASLLEQFRQELTQLNQEEDYSDIEGTTIDEIITKWKEKRNGS